MAIASAKEFDSFLRLCGRQSAQACAFSAGNPTATKAKWDALLARVKRTPIIVGSTTYNYAAILSLVAGSGNARHRDVLAGAGRSSPAGLAGSSQKRGRPPPAAPAARVTRTQRYSGNEQRLAILCADSPSPPAGLDPRLQRLLARKRRRCRSPGSLGQSLAPPGRCTKSLPITARGTPPRTPFW